MRVGRRISTVLLTTALAAPSCGRTSGPALPPRPQVVDVTMREYGFELEPPTTGGRVVFLVRNGGQLTHELVMVFLEEGFPPIDEQLRGSERRVVPTFARLPERQPDGSGVFAVDLEAGRYGFACFVPDPDGTQHAQKGMSTEFRVS